MTEVMVGRGREGGGERDRRRGRGYSYPNTRREDIDHNVKYLS